MERTTRGGAVLDFGYSRPYDLLPEGHADLLWRNIDGSVGTWQMNGIQHADTGFGKSALSWQIAGTGDLSGDGKSDILWRTKAVKSEFGS